MLHMLYSGLKSKKKVKFREAALFASVHQRLKSCFKKKTIIEHRKKLISKKSYSYLLLYFFFHYWSTVERLGERARAPHLLSTTLNCKQTFFGIGTVF